MFLQCATSATILSTILALSSYPQNVYGFSTLYNPSSLGLPARAHSKTAIFESDSGSEASASEKAARLKKKAEEAKRKAEELKKVAEAKAAAAMSAVKKANEKGSSNVDADNKSAEAVASKVESSPSKEDVEPAAKKVIEKDSKKMEVKATAVKEVKEKASSRVIPSDVAIIPINEETIEFTAGVLAGFLALAFGAGPVLAVVSAAAANYVSKKDDFGELNELVQSASKASLSTYNWLAKLDSKYTILGKISESLDDAINKLKISGGESGEAVEKIESLLDTTTKQLKQLADETDFFEGSKQALGAVGDIIETSVDKAADANKEYKLTERAAEAAMTVAKSAIEKAKSAKD